LAGAAAARASELPAGPVLLAVDNTIESLAVLAGLAAAGVDCAVFESGSSLLRDEASAAHALGAAVVVGAAEVPARYQVVPAADLVAPLPGRDVLADLAARPAADPAVWQFTSGSTGEPRLARQTAANLVRGGLIYASRYGITGRDTLLVTTPMAHSFGLVGGLVCALATGASLVALTGFRPAAVRAALSDGATVALGTPLVYELMVRSARPAVSRLRMALSSGGPLDPELAEAARRQLGCPVYQVYGCTEMGIIASQFPRAEPWPATSVGTAAPGVELRLAEPSAAGDGAELFVRTGTMFGCYLGAAAPPVDADGWYRTGDLAGIDQDGHLSLVRRKDSFINVGGRKVNPARVERIMAGHHAVTEVAVYGAEAAGGEEVVAAVALSASCTREDLVAYCRARLAPYEVPGRLHLVGRLPRTGMGKVDRSRLPR
jgi:acyl-CoA synthetase (AMP-forming)/AMP-acid ligase II